MIKALMRGGLFFLFCGIIIASQVAYDASRAAHPLPHQPPSAALVKIFDLGLHTATASFLWINTRVELPFLPQGPEHFLSGLRAVNDLDPHWSTPYAFTVLVLPMVAKYTERVSAALAVGERGLASADPNWQIPFYMGTIYQLERADRANAAKYFDVAANTSGVPDIIRSFALNYGIHPDILQETKTIWTAIYATSPNQTVRERATLHITHLEMLDYLNGAVKAFHQKNGRYPTDLDELVRVGAIPNVPKSPFGMSFVLYGGGVVGIAPNS